MEHALQTCVMPCFHVLIFVNHFAEKTDVYFSSIIVFSICARLYADSRLCVLERELETEVPEAELKPVTMLLM